MRSRQVKVRWILFRLSCFNRRGRTIDRNPKDYKSVVCLLKSSQFSFEGFNLIVFYVETFAKNK